MSTYSRYLKFDKYFMQRLKEKRPISAFDITIFFRQFATLIAAGIPIVQCCEVLEKSQEKIAMRLLIYTIKRDMLTGKTLSESIRHHRQYFNELTCQLIHLGEHTGQLDTLFGMIATHQEKLLAFKRRIHQALFYPAVILFMTLLVTFSMLIFVIPLFAELFHETEVTLPPLTLALFALSAGILQHLPLVLILVVLCVLTLFCSKHFLRKKRYLLQLIMTLPLIKPSTHKITLARFSRNLALTFTCGIPIKEALWLTQTASGHVEFTSMMTELRRKISSGLQLHHAMEMIPYFPNLMIQMVKVGEESGKLGPMLNKMADFLEAEVDLLISRASLLLEPLIMIGLGVLIGLVVIGMYLPIFRLGSAL